MRVKRQKKWRESEGWSLLRNQIASHGKGEPRGLRNPYLSIRFPVHRPVTNSLSRFVPRFVRLFDMATRLLFVAVNAHCLGYDLLPCFQHCGSNISDTVLLLLNITSLDHMLALDALCVFAIVSSSENFPKYTISMTDKEE